MTQDGSGTSSISDADRDIAIRTMIGEEGSPTGQAGVASVMLNRAQTGKFGGNSLSAVAFAPNQFEAWTRNSHGLLAIPSDDPRYQAAAKIFDGVASGQLPDMTGGATHFYAPKAQAALGRQAPAWAAGQGAQLGQSLFYAPNGTVAYKPPAAQQAIAAATNGNSTVPMSDPFDDFPTTAAPAAAAATAQPAAKGAATAPAAAMADPFDDFPTTAGHAPSVAPKAPPSDVAPGPNGLMWNAAGGYDPKTGELVMAGKPMSAPSEALSATRSGLAGFAEGIPVAGPYIQSGIEKGAAAIRAVTGDSKYSDELASIQSRKDADIAAHPVVNKLGQVAGAVDATIPMMVAAPAAFGLSEGGLAVNSLASGATGAGLNAADAAVRSGGDLNAIKNGAIVGGIMGGLGPAAGAAVGAGFNGASNLLARTTPAARNVSNILSDIGMSVPEASQSISRMGPNATLADINPALTTEAGGLASLGGQPTSVLKGAMAARAAGADNRVVQAVDAALGPAPDLTAAKEGIVGQAQNAAAPFYNAARNNPTPMDITPVLNSIDAQAKNAVGGEAAILSKVKGYLTDQKVGMVGPDGQPTTMIVPKDDPGALLKVRQALDGDIESLQRNGTIDGTSAGKSALRTASDLRSQIDGVLKSDPNIAAGDAAFAGHMGLKDAMDEGTQLFTRGTRLQDFQRTLAAASPQQVEAMRAGARVAINDALTEARRGTLSGAQSMFGKASANRAKLDALFPQAGDVFDMLNGEAAMRATEQRVAQNSATAERAAVQQKYSPQQSPGIGAVAPILGEAVAGGPGAALAVGGRAVYGAVKNAFTEASRKALTTGTARGLVATGPEQQQFLEAVARASKTNGATNALSSAGNAASNLFLRAPAGYVRNALAGGSDSRGTTSP